MPRPLEGLRVIDVGTRIGAPFCAGLLGEWGADVVKVEQPRGGRLHAHHRALRRRLLAVLGRRGPGSQERHLRPAHARGPGPLPPAGVDGRRRVRELPARDPGGLGTRAPPRSTPDSSSSASAPSARTAPTAGRPGLDRLGVAYGGLLHLTGEADRPPVRPGVTVADYLTGVFAAEAALAALYRRDAGRGPAGARGTGERSSTPRSTGRSCASWNGRSPAYDRLGTVRAREGNRLSNSAPLDNYPTADGQLRLRGGRRSDANFARLCRAMGRPDLLEDPRFTTLADRARNGDTINGVVAALDRDAAARPRSRRRVSPTTSRWRRPTTARDIALDPHFEARHDLVAVDDPVLGPIRQQAPYPRLVGEDHAGADRSARARARTTTRCGATSWACRRPSSTSSRPRGSCERSVRTKRCHRRSR